MQRRGEEGVGFQLRAYMLLKFDFLTVQEKQVMTSTFFELEIYQETETSWYFLEKILYPNKFKVKDVSLNVPEHLKKTVLNRT